MTAAPLMIKALNRVKNYLIENEDILAPMPTRSEIDSINEALDAAIYVPIDDTNDPIEKNGLPTSVNYAIKGMSESEIKNFFKSENINRIKNDVIREYINNSDNKSFIINKIEKELNNIIIDRFFGN